MPTSLVDECYRRAEAARRCAEVASMPSQKTHFLDLEQRWLRAAESVAKDLEATRLERCKKARASYDNSINSQRLYREKEGGQREYLTDAELAQARVDARKAVDAICGPQG